MLDSNRFKFTEYEDSRVKERPGFTVGFSGALLLSTDKQTGKLYIIKHTYAHNAANEYVASWLAEKIGVPTPHAELISHTPAFASPYAVAIEFIDGFTPLDKDAVPKEMQQDLIGQFALNAIVVTDDMIQMNAADGHIYSYDFSEAFYISDEILLNMVKQNEETGIEYIKTKLSGFRNHLNIVDFDFPVLAREFNLDPEKQRLGMIDTAKRVLDITEDDIYSMSAELENLYPQPYAIYYEECIHHIQEFMKRF